jgi:hypothetical protein
VRCFNSFKAARPPQTSRWKKELSYDFRIESSALNPVRRGYAVISARFPVSDVTQNAKQGLVKRSLRDRKKTCALIGGAVDD